MNPKLEIARRDAKQKEHLKLMQRLLQEFVYIDITEYQYEDIKTLINFLYSYTDMQFLVGIIRSKSNTQKCDQTVLKLIGHLKMLKKGYNKHREFLKRFGYLEVICEAEKTLNDYQTLHGKVNDLLGEIINS